VKDLDQPLECLSYNLDTFCQASGLGRTDTYRAIREGKLKAKKRGNKFIVLKPDGEEYLRSLPDAVDGAA